MLIPLAISAGSWCSCFQHQCVQGLLKQN